ncbi:MULTISPECIES: sulfate transporter CysZ [Vibrio]|jgi:CysZ protein|uniref:Sulfate transporter CysZ n=1 Tax=Vibrio coralliilyticus TaxID=190893 RepID=A0AAE5EPH3_9VIBR|nr:MULTISPECIES: sulfate transporter CysZ [Vibrio]ANW25013.1 sulfate transporter CysZ [Vibrio coralliilyticus]EEX35304.1 sulfate transporter CysZ-type [Vibrio coralliilyticus ATCC BAA-450]ERB63723.1 cysteine biosynthesis protein CysZ [Vibrio coralliilyticus OCN008]MCM5508757.1 sulfate transporter CysZ [Vibrio sp. SCSIO 43169]MDE3900189.1 sulfate transporter CysZ [Vibrio sp. CC007]
MNSNIQQRSGFGYFFYGLELAVKPGIRQFVLLPLLANVLLVGGALFYLFSHLDVWIEQLMGQLPGFLSWLSYILWPLLVLTILATFSYFFSTLANFVAAPFNGLLAEKVEEHLTGKAVNDDGMLAVVKDTPRILAREWKKLLYVLPKAIGLFILLLIPALGQTLGPILWFGFTAWMLAVQYCDYPFDNHKVPFNEMRNSLKQKQGKAYSFGALVAIFTTIPILNLIVMPVAVCGATAIWVAEFKR